WLAKLPIRQRALSGEGIEFDCENCPPAATPWARYGESGAPLEFTVGLLWSLDVELAWPFGCATPRNIGAASPFAIPIEAQTGGDDDGSSTDSRHFGGRRQNDPPATTRGHGPFDVDPGGFRSCADRSDGRLPDPRRRDDERAGPRGEQQHRQ